MSDAKPYYVKSEHLMEDAEGPYHDPDAMYIGVYVSSEFKALQDEIAACHKLTSIADGKTKRIHESWYTATREQLLEALEFQGATTRFLLEDNNEYHVRYEKVLEETIKYRRLLNYIGELITESKKL